ESRRRTGSFPLISATERECSVDVRRPLLGETDSLHRLAHVGVALRHEGREFGARRPCGAIAPARREVLPLLALGDLLDCRNELRRNIGGAPLVAVIYRAGG